MVLPRRIRPLTSVELGHLTVDRLLAYRKQVLSLESSLAASDYTDFAHSLDNTYIWFKDDPRWLPLYTSILDELASKKFRDDAE